MVHSSDWDQYINLVILNNTGGWGWSVGGWGPYFTWALPGNQYDSTQTHDWIFAYYTGYLYSGEKETRYGAISGLEDDKVIGLNQGITIDTTISWHTYWKIEYYFEVHMLRPAGSVVFKYLGNEATGGSTASNFAVYGSNFTFQVNGFTRTGYEFYRWALSINGNFIGYYSSGQLYGTWTITNSDAIALAIWSGNTYTIYYYMTGGEDGGTTPENTAIYGSNFTFQANGYTKTGYTFYRWLVRDNNYSFIGYYNAGQLYGIWDRLSNHHAFAQWSAKKYTITYDANGGSGTLATNPQTATYDSSFTFQANVFTKIGYTFFKWELYDSGGSTRLNKEYDSGQSYGTWNIPYNIIAKAKWNADSYTVTFNSNGKGTGKTVTQGVDTTVTCPILKAVGYVFGGWAISSTSTTVNKEGNATFVLGAANQTFFAIWTENTNGSVSFSELQTVYTGTHPIGISEYRTQSGQTTANSKIALSADFKGKGPAP